MMVSNLVLILRGKYVFVVTMLPVNILAYQKRIRNPLLMDGFTVVIMGKKMKMDIFIFTEGKMP